ncbi:hypothetical protein EHQ53_03200 [Leptospira langatensis]|uniref:Phage protein Gp138 N-terminal domain-containing protein n=1 Tax=Leptospira langatensis TaxID=2484983 RepID=A0A5F1ZY84_9LEPT|nr:Gp138 family membrane-puncturing spike protein [Leptospira langatensis]TGK04168.1 hypothetical protein EHO57_03430 [Leptospira langatensis]TGL43648.1 hypothetical protein EHQ53_03200 [Leptospira langatensis]
MSFAELLDRYTDKKGRSIQLGMVCKIESFDASSMRADVLPMVREKNELDDSFDYPVIPGIPVEYVQIGQGCYIKPFYQRGDFVWVGFSTFDTSSSLQGSKQEVKPDSKIFGLENACVLGAIAKQGWEEPQNLIKFEDNKLTLKVGNTELSLGSDGVKITGNLSVPNDEISGHVVKEKTSESSTAVSIGDIKTTFNTHTHLSSAPGSSTGTPNSQIGTP